MELLISILSFLGGILKRVQKVSPEKNLSGTKMQDYSLIWLGEETYFLRDLQGGLNRYDISIEDYKVSLVLEGSICVNTIKMIQVESVELDINGQDISSNWESDSFSQPLEISLRFDIPINIARGEKTAKIRAIVDGDEYYPDPFKIELPQKS